MSIRRVFLLLFFLSCSFSDPIFRPRINKQLCKEWVVGLPSAFPALSSEEMASEWGKELFLATQFAKQLQLRDALLGFQRARWLMPEGSSRTDQADFDLFLTYYLLGEYKEAVQCFEASPLSQAQPDHPAFFSLLILLFDSYSQLGEENKLRRLDKLLEKGAPELLERLHLCQELQQGNVDRLQEATAAPFLQQRLSPARARLFNTFLPGSGYWYAGLKGAAVTCFCLNSSFLGASIYSFASGNWPAGLIFASIEIGWYVGGINGAGISAHEYNEWCYAHKLEPMLYEERLMPELMLTHAY